VVVEADLDVRRVRTGRGLTRAIANVAENAARHSPSGQPVRLRAASDADGVEVVVEDAGDGFASSFELAPFRRGAVGGRAGLGLASSQRAIERLGGTLRLAGRLGGGASVSLRLPRRGLSQ
jgi:two-component system sensor histidine kinase KdpD